MLYELDQLGVRIKVENGELYLRGNPGKWAEVIKLNRSLLKAYFDTYQKGMEQARFTDSLPEGPSKTLNFRFFKELEERAIELEQFPIQLPSPFQRPRDREKGAVEVASGRSFA